MHRNIVITGATRGIGRSMALKFIELGHTVWGCGTKQPYVTRLNEQTPAAGQFDQVDVTCAEQVAQWAASIIDQSGPPTLLINNAGMINQPAAFCDIPANTFVKLIHVNVIGVSNVMRAFLPAMLEAQQGIIINLSSGAGLHGYPNISAYCTTKFAIEGLSQSVAAELPPGMACIPLSPGVINTDMLQRYWGEDRASECDSPEAWADYAVPFILALGPEHNGQSIRVSNIEH